MNPLQTWMLNGLLLERKSIYTKQEEQWLIMLSTKMRHTILSRNEGRALAYVWLRTFASYPKRDPGRIDEWEGSDVKPEPETEHEGGPGRSRPPGTGDGNNVPTRAGGDFQGAGPGVVRLVENSYGF